MNPGTLEAALAADVLGYWFEHIDENVELDFQHPTVRRWHSKDPAIDAQIRSTFGSLYDAVRARVQAGWHPDSLAGRVGAVIALDQFPRNMFRDSPRMYESDALARGLCLAGLQDSRHRELALAHRLFLYMPLMHSEAIEDQRLALELFGALRDDAFGREATARGFFEMPLGSAHRHAQNVQRFGRFPHRNGILQRPTSAEEAEFLKEENSAF